MFELIFSEKINNDIVSSINYIKDTLKAPMAAQNHAEELKKKYIKLKENPFARPLVQNKYLASKRYTRITRLLSLPVRFLWA